MEKMLISGVAKDENVARISVIGVPDKPGLAFRIFSKLAQKNVNVDIILQSIGRNGTKDISFTVEKDKMDATIELMQSYVETIGASSVVFDDDVAKVSIVGAGMESHPGVALLLSSQSHISFSGGYSVFNAGTAIKPLAVQRFKNLWVRWQDKEQRRACLLRPPNSRRQLMTMHKSNIQRRLFWWMELR